MIYQLLALMYYNKTSSLTDFNHKRKKTNFFKNLSDKERLLEDDMDQKHYNKFFYPNQVQALYIKAFFPDTSASQYNIV